MSFSNNMIDDDDDCTVREEEEEQQRDLVFSGTAAADGDDDDDDLSTLTASTRLSSTTSCYKKMMNEDRHEGIGVARSIGILAVTIACWVTIHTLLVMSSSSSSSSSSGEDPQGSNDRKVATLTTTTTVTSTNRLRSESHPIKTDKKDEDTGTPTTTSTAFLKAPSLDLFSRQELYQLIKDEDPTDEGLLLYVNPSYHPLTSQEPLVSELRRRQRSDDFTSESQDDINNNDDDKKEMEEEMNPRETKMTTTTNTYNVLDGSREVNFPRFESTQNSLIETPPQKPQSSGTNNEDASPKTTISRRKSRKTHSSSTDNQRGQNKYTPRALGGKKHQYDYWYSWGGGYDYSSTKGKGYNANVFYHKGVAPTPAKGTVPTGSKGIWQSKGKGKGKGGGNCSFFGRRGNRGLAFDCHPPVPGPLPTTPQPTPQPFRTDPPVPTISTVTPTFMPNAGGTTSSPTITGQTSSPTAFSPPTLIPTFQPTSFEQSPVSGFSPCNSSAVCNILALPEAANFICEQTVPCLSETGICLESGIPRFTMTWKGQDDLDLRVITPGGFELNKENRVDPTTGCVLTLSTDPAVDGGPARDQWAENVACPPDGSATVGTYTFFGVQGGQANASVPDSYALIAAEFSEVILIFGASTNGTGSIGPQFEFNWTGEPSPSTTDVPTISPATS